MGTGDQSSAGDDTKEAIADVGTVIDTLDDKIEELLGVGTSLANLNDQKGKPAWDGEQANTFRDVWESSVTTSMRENVSTLKDINDQALVSADNIIDNA